MSSMVGQPGHGTPHVRPLDATLTFVIDGGGSAITTGVKGDLVIPFDCQIEEVRLLADQSGSVVVDLWRCTYDQYDAGGTHPVSADKITASTPPTLTSQTKNRDYYLQGWARTLCLGDVLRFNVNSITTVTRVTVFLLLRRVV